MPDKAKAPQEVRNDIPDGWKPLFDDLASSLPGSTRIKAVREHLGRLLVVPDISTVPPDRVKNVDEAVARCWRNSWDHCIDCGNSPDLESRGRCPRPFCTDCASLRHPAKFSPITIKQFHYCPDWKSFQDIAYRNR